MRKNSRIRIIVIVIIQILFCNNSRVQAVTSTDLISKSEKAVVKIVHNYTFDIVGTGFIISPDGFALSCFHVFENSSDLMVQDINGNLFSIDSIYGYSKEEDYILFKISFADSKEFHFLELSDNQAEKGDEVLAIGHTAGYPYLATTGIIAGYRENVADDTIPLRNSIFFTAPVYYASSGSPLISVKDAKVVGIVAELTLYYDKPVPNINVGVDVTCGFRYLHNKETLCYKDFCTQVLDKDEMSQLLSYLLELIYSNDTIDFGYDYNLFDEFDFDSDEEHVIENTYFYEYIDGEEGYYALCRSELVNQIVHDATLFVINKRVHVAERKIKKAYKLTDDQEALILAHADLLIFANKLHKTQRLLLKNIDKYPESELLHKKLADVYTLLGNYDKAYEYYNKAYDFRTDMWFY